MVLVSSRNPLNIGAAARAMSNFGFSRLRVVNPYEKAFRTALSAVGAAELLASAEEYDSVADARWPTARWWWERPQFGTGNCSIPCGDWNTAAPDP